LLQYKDPVKQSHIQELKDEKARLRNETITESLQKKFNIVSHQGPPRKFDTMPKTMHYSKRDFNLLTNLKHLDHTITPLLYDEEFVLEKIRRKSFDGKKNSTSVLTKTRDFNIVSNNFKVDHDRRMQEDYNTLKLHVTKKFNQTHDFDLVKGEYFDEKKEEKFLDQRSLLNSVQGSNWYQKLPPRFLLLFLYSI
jgi:hypothetical protein